jgi:hypothetical protein
MILNPELLQYDSSVAGYPDWTEQVDRQFYSDPRFRKVYDFLTPEKNPQFFEALQIIWNSWGVGATFNEFQNISIPLSRIHDMKVQVPDLPQPWEMKRLWVVSDVHNHIEEILQEGGRVSFNIKQYYRERPTRDYCWSHDLQYPLYFYNWRVFNLARTEAEIKGGKIPALRSFEVRVHPDDGHIALELFPNKPKSERKQFNGLSDFLRYAEKQVFDSQGNLQPGMSVTTYES